MFPLKHGETVVRVRRRMVLDPYSQEETLGSWEDADEAPIKGVAVAPTSSIEVDSESRQMVITGMSLYCGVDADVLPEDRIRARSGLWEVEGERQEWVSPFTGWMPGCQFAIRKVVG